MTPSEANSDPHIQITNQLNPVISNSSENEEIGVGATQSQSDAQVETETKGQGAEPGRIRTALDLPTIMRACPEFASWARDMGGYLQDWSDLHRAAGQLRPMIGVSDHAWRTAQDRLGKPAAAAALALVFDKHATGEVASPGGYLRGMIDKAGAGELHLERSFYGRISGQGATARC